MAFAQGKPGFYRLHSTEAYGEEYQGSNQPGAHTFQQPERNDCKEDCYDNDELRPGELPVTSHEALIQHAGAGKEQYSSCQRYRDHFENPVTQE